MLYAGDVKFHGSINDFYDSIKISNTCVRVSG